MCDIRSEECQQSYFATQKVLLIFQLIIDVLLFLILISILVIIGTRPCRRATQVGTALKFIASFVLLMLLAVVYRVIANIIVLSHGQENSNGIVSTDTLNSKMLEVNQVSYLPFNSWSR